MNIVCVRPGMILCLISIIAYSAEIHAKSNRDIIYNSVMKKFKPYAACLNAAATKYQVPEWILMAVTSHEDGKLHGYIKAPNGTKDYGATCINDVRFADFERKGMNVTREKVMESPCYAIEVASFLLKTEELKESGRTGQPANWLTVAANYHYNYRGKYPKWHFIYKSKIEAKLDQFKNKLQR